MSQKDFLLRLVSRLQACGIPYMISGSLGSSVHGEPRATNDVDLVIAPMARQLEAFIESLGDDYYVSPTAAKEALRARSIFNVIDHETGWKADLIIRKERAFSVEEFSRRRAANILGTEAMVVSAEDAILSKLEWAKQTGSEVQLRDALGVAVVQWASLDRGYLQKWASELGVGDLLETLLSHAAKLERPERGEGR